MRSVLRRRPVRAVCAVLMTLLFSFVAFGQAGGPQANNKASIHGAVTDQTQAVVVGANVVLSNTAGFKAEVHTNDKGAYSFDGLDAGTYTIAVTAQNFAVKTLDYITVTAGLELTLDAQLEPASRKTEVNVNPAVWGKLKRKAPASPERSRKRKYCRIGLNGRNFTQLIALAPGVSNQTGQDEAKVGVVGSVKYSVNGGPRRVQHIRSGWQRRPQYRAERRRQHAHGLSQPRCHSGSEGPDLQLRRTIWTHGIGHGAGNHEVRDRKVARRPLRLHPQ